MITITPFQLLRCPSPMDLLKKFLARLTQQADLNRPVEIQLPRMSFEFNGITYDPQRKLTTTQTFQAVDKDDNKIKETYMPVPYNMNFELSIYTKINDDMLQIIEQILPYFPTRVFTNCRFSKRIRREKRYSNHHQ